MRKQTLYITSILILAMFLLSACGPKTEATPTPDTDSIVATSIAQTLQAMAETQTAQVTPTLESTATPMVLPSVTPATVSLPTSTIQTVSLPTNCLISGLVSETIPDGTIIAKGTSFTKTWSIRNGGTCTWGTNYKMVFQRGDLLGAASESVNLTQNVDSGMMTAVTIKMTAPNTDGWYTGYWQLQTDAGVNVGDYTVNIYVGTATASPFSVTSVTYYAANTNVTVTTCGSPFNIPIYITTDGPGTVSYSISSSSALGGATKSSDITFTAAGKQTIYYPITILGDVDLDIDVYIVSPNHQTFYLRNSDAQCP
ncbi:MAG: NBR1-Ig-like domain-containing protein [Anaerolineaceae bacterium]